MLTELKMWFLAFCYAGINALFAWVVTVLPGAHWSFHESLLWMTLMSVCVLEARLSLGKT